MDSFASYQPEAVNFAICCDTILWFKIMQITIIKELKTKPFVGTSISMNL